ncbi:MAG: hypothetical protein WB783_21545 [Arenicellales bacterium]
MEHERESNDEALVEELSEQLRESDESSFPPSAGKFGTSGE